MRTYTPSEIALMFEDTDRFVEERDYNLLVDEYKRLGNREGNAHVQLLTPTHNDPWQKTALSIVDYGVSDNVYVCELPHELESRLKLFWIG